MRFRIIQIQEIHDQLWKAQCPSHLHGNTVKAKAGGYIISLPRLKTTGYAECMGTSKLICGSAEMESLIHRLVPDKNLLILPSPLVITVGINSRWSNEARFFFQPM